VIELLGRVANKDKLGIALVILDVSKDDAVSLYETKHAGSEGTFHNSVR